MNAVLDNPKSGRIRAIASLHRKKTRLETGRFLVEGPQAVRELLTHAPEAALDVYISYDGDGFVELERLADEHGVYVTSVTREVMQAMSDTVTPQGIVAVAKMEDHSLEETLRDAGLVAVLHEVRDPGNAGTVLRAADAAGADAVIFAGDSIDPWNPKVVRSTTGSLFHLPVVTGVTLEDVRAVATAQGMTLLAADVGGENLAPEEPLLKERVAWVFGNEARGLTAEALALTDRSLKLPMFGKAESLNLATAASVCLYTTAFARRGN